MSDLIGWFAALAIPVRLVLITAAYAALRGISRRVDWPVIRKMLLGVPALVESIKVEVLGLKTETRFRAPRSDEEQIILLQDLKRAVRELHNGMHTVAGGEPRAAGPDSGVHEGTAQPAFDLSSPKPDGDSAKGPCLIALPVLRDVVDRRVRESSLRTTAREVGMSPTGLKRFIDGAIPYGRTHRRLELWYLRFAADQR